MTMFNVIKAAIFTPTYKGWGLPLLFWGEPGVAKSDIIESVGAAYGMHVEILSPGERGEGAFGVTPMPTKIGSAHYITYPLPEWVLSLEKHDGRGIIFVDELNTAQGSVKPALLGLIQAKRIGGGYLGDHARVIGAANPPDDAADGSDLPASVANRLGHYDWEPPTFEEWNDWLWSVDDTKKKSATALNPAKEEARVLAAWPEAFSRARTLITGYLGSKRIMLHRKPNIDDPNLARAWPSRRSWYLASVAIASATVHRLDDDEGTKLVRSFIGEAATKELRAYEAAADLPNAAEVLDGVTAFEHDPLRLDITRAVLNSAAVLVADPKCPRRPERLTALWGLLAQIIEDGVTDLAIPPTRTLAKAQPFDSGKRLTDHKTGQKVIAALKPTMEAAGYTV